MADDQMPTLQTVREFFNDKILLYGWSVFRFCRPVCCSVIKIVDVLSKVYSATFFYLEQVDVDSLG